MRDMKGMESIIKVLNLAKEAEDKEKIKKETSDSVNRKKQIEILTLEKLKLENELLKKELNKK